jgi:hypothetical protein
MLEITSHSKVPLRLATMLWLCSGNIEYAVWFAFGHFIYNLLFKQSFSVGIAPLVIGLFFIRKIDEYVGSVHT